MVGVLAMSAIFYVIRRSGKESDCHLRSLNRFSQVALLHTFAHPREGSLSSGLMHPPIQLTIPTRQRLGLPRDKGREKK